MDVIDKMLHQIQHFVSDNSVESNISTGAILIYIFMNDKTK